MPDPTKPDDQSDATDQGVSATEPAEGSNDDPGEGAGSPDDA